MAESALVIILSGRTLNIRDLNEVIALLEKHHYSKASYYLLGLRLLLSDNTLRSIEQEHRGQVDRCFTECLASWLRKADDVETPTIDTLITALRGIGENAVADGINEERQISGSEIINYDRPTATPTVEVNQDHSDQPMILGVRVHEMENKMRSHPELHPIAYSLQQKFCDLVADVQQSLIDHNVNIKVIKVMIRVYLNGGTEDHLMLKKCNDLLLEIQDINELFDFLIDNNFIGYLNYNLLKRLSKRIPQDSLKNQVYDYEKKYAELLNTISCNDLVHLFDEWSHLSPNTPIGLPRISFRLGSPWLHSRFYTWVSTFGEFSWSHCAFLEQLRRNCIIITYAILPCVLDDVMRDLKDPVILKKLEDNDITVVELPQEEEDFDGKEEDPQIESTAKIEPVSRVDASSVIQTTSSEGSFPTTSTTTVTSKANQQEMPLFKQRPEAASIGKEFRSFRLGWKLIRSIESDTKPKEVMGLLEAGADPNTTEYSGGPSALITAIEKDNTDIVKLLLEKGADPNATRYSGGPSAIIIAIEKDNTDIVKLLLEKGADPNATEYSRGPSVVMTAIKKNNIGIVEVLLDKRADPNIADTHGGTPLLCASETGNANIIKLLITNGKADVNAVDKRKRTPLFNAVESGSIEAVDILLTNGARTDVVSTYGETLLHCAGKSGKVEMLEFWIKRGDYDVNVKDKYNRTPLFGAVESGSIKAVDILLTNGARTDVAFEGSPFIFYNATPLHCASRNGNANIIKLLITKGKADVNAVDKYNRTPLFVAVESGSIEAVDILLTNGARTDVKDEFGDTPLLLAIAARDTSTQIIKLLINKGQADVTAACEKYDINPELSRSEIAEVLITKIPRSGSMLSRELREMEDVMLTDELSMPSSQPDKKQLSRFSTRQYDDKILAEPTHESAYRSDKSSTTVTGQGEEKRCNVL